jgi:uncharacterized protein YodC (DUF2158 family)
MADAEFQKGDAVRLKSGGPRMTIADLTQVNGEPYLVCVWYDQHRREASRSYPASSMKLASIEALGDWLQSAPRR